MYNNVCMYTQPCNAILFHTIALQIFFHGCGVSSPSISATRSWLKHGTTLKEQQSHLYIRGGVKEAMSM